MTIRRLAKRVHSALGAYLDESDGTQPNAGPAPNVLPVENTSMDDDDDVGILLEDRVDQLWRRPPETPEAITQSLQGVFQSWQARHLDAQGHPYTSNVAPDLVKAANGDEGLVGGNVGKPGQDKGFQGYTSDPRYALTGFGYVERPGPLTTEGLRRIGYRVPIVSDIIQTRVNQVASFCTPQTNKFEPGFRLAMREVHRHPNSREQREAVRLTEMMLSCGRTSNLTRRPGLDTFIRQAARDAFYFDAPAVEIVPGRDRKPAYWRALDAGSIRIHRSWAMDPVNATTKTVQVIDMRPVAEFGPEELIFDPRNPRTDMRVFGYGFPEIEMVFSVISQFIDAITHNSLFFRQGTTQPGILNIKGKMPQKKMRALRRFWYTLVSGNSNAWVTPLLNAEEGLEWISLNKSNRDMEFSLWLDFIIKLICASFLLDPTEINFKFGGGGGKQMFSSADRAKVAESKDRGLRPLLRYFERIMNEYIIWPINPDFSFEFVGLLSMTAKEYADLMTQRVRSVFTVNEIRAELDLDPIKYGDTILDPNLLAHARETRALEQGIDPGTGRLLDPGEAQQMQANSSGASSPDGASSPEGALTPLGPDGSPNPLPPPSDPNIIHQGGLRAPTAAAAPKVGRLAGDPTRADQIKELESLLQPVVAT